MVPLLVLLVQLLLSLFFVCPLGDGAVSTSIGNAATATATGGITIIVAIVIVYSYYYCDTIQSNFEISISQQSTIISSSYSGIK